MFTQKISATGYLVAWLRSLYAEPGSFAYDIARITRAQETFPQLIKAALRNKFGEKLSDDFIDEGCERYLAILRPVAPFIELRDYCALELIRQEWDVGWSVIEIATGVSPISFEVAIGLGIRCLATDRDLSGVLGEVAKIILNNDVPDYLDFQRVDATISGELANCCEDQRVIVSHQGLLQYLYLAEKEKVRRSIRELRKQSRSVKWITPDFTTRDQIRSLLGSPSPLRQASEVATLLSGRRIREHYFREYRTLANFLAYAGSNVRRHRQTDLCQLSHLRSPDIVGMSMTTLRQIAEARDYMVIEVD